MARRTTPSKPERVLISGGGIAGLTLAIRLKEAGYEPLVVEREPALRTEGYMMDFFGTGWDVAERMGLVERLRAIRYPIDALEFVGRDGEAYYTVPISRVRRALDGRYVYLRRPDLERILYDRARERGVTVRFGRSVKSLKQTKASVSVTFDDGTRETFALVFGADGVHSRIRELVFGGESRFSRFLGGYVAAFHLPRHAYPIGQALKLYEEPERVAAFYPLDEQRMDATYVLRHEEVSLKAGERLPFLRKQFEGAGWIAEDMLQKYEGDEPIYFDSLTQIVMDRWHEGRVALLGDACGCLTLLAGQGSHMAMAGGYVLARELVRHGGDHEAAFAAYQDLLMEPVTRKQNEAAGFETVFIPSESSRPWLRRLAVRLLFGPLLLRLVFRMLGGRSALAGYS